MNRSIYLFTPLEIINRKRYLSFGAKTMCKEVFLTGFSLLLVPVLLFANFSEKVQTKIFCGHDIQMDRFEKGLMPPPRPWGGIGPKVINSTHFRIHFDTTGTHATTRAYAESVKVYAETSWARASRLGWVMPPPDNNRGGDNRYDIYIQDLVGYLGVCIEDSAYTDPYPDGYSSWVEIENTFTSWNRLRALVAHEFHHSCQKRYSQFENDPQRYFYENTSVYMEHVIFPDTNTLLGRLSESPSHLLTPHWAITVRDELYYNFHYSGGLWAWFLHEYYDATPCRPMIRIWDLCGMHAGSHTRLDTDSVLRIYYDSNFQKAVGHYAIWRYFTGIRHSPYYFSDDSSYITSTILRTHSTYPASGNQGTSNPSGPGGCNFIQFRNFGNNRVTLYFDGQNGYEWSAYVIGKRGGISYEYKISLEPTQDTGRITIPGWEYDTIALIPVVTHWTSSAESLTYSYNVTLGDELAAITEPTNVYFDLTLDIYPNPVKTQTTIKYSIPVSKNGKLKIYDATGRAVCNFELMGNKRPASILWDKKDDFGQMIKSGIYFVRLMVDDKTISKKMVIE